jgi:hypothetical protein
MSTLDSRIKLLPTRLTQISVIALIGALVSGCGGSSSPLATLDAPSVANLSPKSAILGENIQISVTGQSLPITATIEIQDMNCQSPFGSTTTSFYIRCIASAVGIKSIRVMTSIDGSLIDASKTITILPPINQVVTRTVDALVGPSSLFQGKAAAFLSLKGINLPDNVTVTAPNCLPAEISVSVSSGFTCTPTVASGSITFTFRNDSVNELPLGQVIGQFTIPVRTKANLIEGRFIKFSAEGVELLPSSKLSNGWECTLDVDTGKLWEVRHDLGFSGGGYNRTGSSESSFDVVKAQYFIDIKKCGSSLWRRPHARELDQIRSKVVADLNDNAITLRTEFTLGMALSAWLVFTDPPYGLGSPNNLFCKLQPDGGGVWDALTGSPSTLLTQCQASGPFATVLVAN